MPLHPFPDPGPDGEEPDSSPLPPAAGEGGPEGDWEDWGGPAGQGLYVCLPPEQLTLAGFAQGGETDTMAPGPLLATVVHAVTGQDGAGLAGCSDDQLMGIISAARRMEARAAWTLMAAVAEYAARHAGSGPADEFAPVELGYELHLTPQSAQEQMQFSGTVAARLPAMFAALGAGQVHPVHVRIAEDETRFLSDQDAARADEILAGQAPGMTYGELRSAAHKLVLKLDPEAAKKRKEAATREAHVRRFREESGNAGMVARELPSDEVLASWQHVEQRALDLRAAGMPGTLQELRVRAYLDLLQERDSRDLPAGPVSAAGSEAHQADLPDQAPSGDGPHPGDRGPGDRGPGDRGPDDRGPGDRGPGDRGPDDSGPGDRGPDDSGPGDRGPDDSGNGSGGNGGPGRRPGGPGGGPGRGGGPSLAALVTITVPLATYQGRSDIPGEVDGFGPLDGDEVRDLAAAAARHPRTRWCVTAVNPDGTAAAHGCLPGRHLPPGPDPPALNITVIPVARGPCDHTNGEVAYHPSRKLAHLIRARNRRCSAPGCTRPAARCDLDHTVPWDQGGITCECDLAPLCRHHHRCKQAEGWRLEQPEPGVLIWHTPSGRTYVSTPTEYPM